MINKLSDITVEQFLKLSDIEDIFKDDEKRMALEIVKIFYPDNSLKLSEFDNFNNILKECLLSKPEFIRRFNHKGVEYGFIPNIEEITTGEYIDLDTYQKSKDTYPKLLSILYRPIIKSYGDLYEIEKYNGVKYDMVMREVSCEILLGSIDFFLTLSEIVVEDLTSYLMKEQMKKVMI